MKRNTLAVLCLVVFASGCGDARQQVRVSNLACAPFAVELLPGVKKLRELRGTVLSRDLTPLEDADVRVRVLGSTVEVARTVTSGTGEFRFPDLASATYQVEVCREGFNASVSLVKVSPKYDRHTLQILLNLAT